MFDSMYMVPQHMQLCHFVLLDAKATHHRLGKSIIKKGLSDASCNGNRGSNSCPPDEAYRK